MGGETIAIDVLLEPDAVVRDLALGLNRAFLHSVAPPVGFELGESRRPHVTVVQSYVRTDELDQALDEVAAVAAAADRRAFDLVADAELRGDPAQAGDDDVVTAVWGMDGSAALLRLQMDVLEALVPFAVAGGDERAFVRTPDEPDVAPSTVRYVERFVDEHAGSSYRPHLTLGRALARDLRVSSDALDGPIAFTAPALAVFQLGDAGTARRQLAHWPS